MQMDIEKIAWLGIPVGFGGFVLIFVGSKCH